MLSKYLLDKLAIFILNVFVCRFEAKTKNEMNMIKDEILNKLQEFGDIKIDF